MGSEDCYNGFGGLLNGFGGLLQWVRRIIRRIIIMGSEDYNGFRGLLQWVRRIVTMGSEDCYNGFGGLLQWEGKLFQEGHNAPLHTFVG